MLVETGLTRDGTFLIENGKITRPVTNFRFNQSLAELLKNIETDGTADARLRQREQFDRRANHRARAQGPGVHALQRQRRDLREATRWNQSPVISLGHSRQFGDNQPSWFLIRACRVGKESATTTGSIPCVSRDPTRARLLCIPGRCGSAIRPIRAVPSKRAAVGLDRLFSVRSIHRSLLSRFPIRLVSSFGWPSANAARCSSSIT